MTTAYAGGEPALSKAVVTPEMAAPSLIKVGKDSWLEFDEDDDGYVEEYSSHRKKSHPPLDHYNDNHPPYQRKYENENGPKYRDHYSHKQYHTPHRYDGGYYDRPKYISRHNAQRILNKRGYYKIHFVHGHLPVYKAKACKQGRHYHVWVNKWGHITKNQYVGYCSRYNRIRDFWLGRRH
ncbi:MAG: hypothetical protein AAF228_04220 [Pseudomonadota bacterium]